MANNKYISTSAVRTVYSSNSNSEICKLIKIFHVVSDVLENKSQNFKDETIVHHSELFIRR